MPPPTPIREIPAHLRSGLTTAEELRLNALERLEPMEGVSDLALDEITHLAAQVCDTPVAGICFVEEDRVWFKSRVGIPVRDTVRSASPFEETILSERLYVIPDAAGMPHFAEQGGIPLGQKHLCFYAGAPLLTEDGNAIGCLFVMAPEPRLPSDVEKNTLRILAQQVVTRLELDYRTRATEREARTRQRVETALMVERNFVSAVLDTVGALVVVQDTAGRVVRFNRICETISGYELPDVVGRTLWETLIPESDRREAIAAFDSLRDGQFPVSYENRWLTRDGRLRRIQWTVTGLMDATHTVSFIIATGIDVTLQREAESTLRESEGRYRQLIEASLGAVFTHTEDGVLLSINSYGAESLGYTVDGMVGRRLEDFVAPSQRGALADYFDRLNRTQEAQGTFHLSHRDGSERVLAYRNRVLQSKAGELYALCFAVDITEKVRAEEKLSTLTQQSNLILDSVGDGILGTDMDGMATVCNPAAAQMLGYREDEIETAILGRNIHALAHHTRVDGTPSPQSESAILRAVRDLKPVRVSTDVFWRKDGSSFPVEYVASPILKEGKPNGVVVAFSDTTERRALDRMKDEFVSTVSHELRTPLTSMRASLGLIASGALEKKPERQRQMLNIAIGNTDRLVNLVNDILELERIGSGKAELHYGSVNAGELMHRAAELQSATASRANLEFHFDLQGEVIIWADADRILQTLTNLLSNAIKFSHPGGHIRLRARDLGNGQAQIEVEDQGRGIPEDKLELIFGRFQQVDASDSRVMGGTGLGLAICRSIVTQHGGMIWAESVLGKGSTFVMTLPTHPSSRLRQ